MTLPVFFELKVKYDDDKLLVIQVQGKQYRRCVEFREGDSGKHENRNKIKGDAELKKFFSWKADVKPVVSFPGNLCKNAGFRPRGTYRGKPVEQFWSYSANKKPDQFIYQKVDIPDEFEVDELVDCVIEDINEFQKSVRNE